MSTPTPSDRLALAVCRYQCTRPCIDCRNVSAAVVRELAQILRERHGGSSSVADWLDGIGGSHG